MPSEFPRSPSLLKGALVVFKPGSVLPSVIVFQYNPETMRRGLEAQHPEAEPGVSAGDTSRVLPPIETFSLTIELDAADQLESGDTVTRLAGLHPALAELELLLYPSSISMIKNQILALAGSSSVAPLSSPMVLFVYGPSRVVPVRVESLVGHGAGVRSAAEPDPGQRRHRAPLDDRSRAARRRAAVRRSRAHSRHRQGGPRRRADGLCRGPKDQGPLVLLAGGGGVHTRQPIPGSARRRP